MKKNASFALQFSILFKKTLTLRFYKIKKHRIIKTSETIKNMVNTQIQKLKLKALKLTTIQI